MSSHQHIHRSMNSNKMMFISIFGFVALLVLISVAYSCIWNIRRIQARREPRTNDSEGDAPEEYIREEDVGVYPPLIQRTHPLKSYGGVSGKKNRVLGGPASLQDGTSKQKRATELSLSPNINLTPPKISWLDPVPQVQFGNAKKTASDLETYRSMLGKPAHEWMKIPISVPLAARKDAFCCDYGLYDSGSSSRDTGQVMLVGDKLANQIPPPPEPRYVPEDDLPKFAWGPSTSELRKGNNLSGPQFERHSPMPVFTGFEGSMESDAKYTNDIFSSYFDEDTIDPQAAEYEPNPVIFSHLRSYSTVDDNVDAEKEPFFVTAVQTPTKDQEILPSCEATNMAVMNQGGYDGQGQNMGVATRLGCVNAGHCKDTTYSSNNIRILETETDSSTQSAQETCQSTSASSVESTPELSAPAEGLVVESPTPTESDGLSNLLFCDACSETFSSDHKFSEHIKLRRCRRHTCRLCSARFALKADLNRHMGTVHRDKQKPARTFVCNNPDCSVRNKQFLRKDNFERHVRRCVGESVMS